MDIKKELKTYPNTEAITAPISPYSGINKIIAKKFTKRPKKEIIAGTLGKFTPK